MRLGIAEAHRLAALRGGRCLSKDYVNVKVPLMWQCGEGHIWEAPLRFIKHGQNGGSWCPLCAREKSRLGLTSAQLTAQRKDGLCLSDRYQHCKAKLTWQCSQGHVWQATLHSVQHGGTWCPKCARFRRALSIELAREVAESRGGRCLSSVYSNNKAKMIWECAKGHQWAASMQNVNRKGTWCPTCNTRHGERDVRIIFETIFVGFRFATARPKSLRVGQRSFLQLDGYNEELSIAFEFQGIQHYKFVYFFHRSPEGYASLLQRDQIKLDLCNNTGIRLIVVPCFVNDRWTFVRSWLLKWFSVSFLFPTAIPS